MAAHATSPETALHASVCVIGSGPAGIACALELARRKIDVILVEGGGRTAHGSAHAPGEAEIVDARRHAPMHDAVHRALGGTSWLWGGRCIPLDPIDFESRSYAPGTGWPIGFEHLAPWYGIACEYANCGQPDFTLAQLDADSARQPLTAGFRPGRVIASDLERWSGEPNFAHRYANALQTSPHVRLLLDSTCIAIDLAADGDHVRSVVIANGATRLRIQADRFVLACGGLEVTRLLLNANAHHDNRIGNRSGMLGRHYMGHVSGKIASVRFNSPPNRTIYHFERDGQGFYVRRRLTVPAATQREHGLLNMAMWLDNHPPADPAHGNGILSLAYLALRTPGLSRMLAAPAIARKVAGSGEERGRHLAHWRNVARGLHRIATFVPPFLYRRYVARPRLPGFFLPSPNNVYALHYHAEHLPAWDSRVSLADSVDGYGMRRLRIDLRYQRADAESVIRNHALLDRHLRETGAGRVDYWMPEAERMDAVLAQASDGFHQLGTTRMAAHWRHGVVDPDCRVFGTRNLYIASSSVFPSSGQANPTLTILALSARLANHLAEQLTDQSTKQRAERPADSGALSATCPPAPPSATPASPPSPRPAHAGQTSDAP